MREDRPLSLTESPSRKRLLADPKPKHCPAAAVAVDSSDRLRKKTRDLPNLSDCHSCGIHINITNPKDKLQTLASFWRVVLLCKKCTNLIESAKLCSYCFSETDAECYRCRGCCRGIHKDCVVRYKCFPPWSYCCYALGFSVCVDCWVPKSLENSIRRRKNKKNALEQQPSSGDSRVSRNLELVVNDAERAVEKKAAVAAQAKEVALRKAVVARTAVELANRTLEFVGKKDDNGKANGSGSGSDVSDSTVVDAELAFQLHRAMNSSPRISRNLCLLNSSHSPVQRFWDCSGNSSVGSLGSKGSLNTSIGKIEECLSNKNDNTDACVSEPSAYVRPTEIGPRVGFGILKQGGLVYKRRKTQECPSNKIGENTDATVTEASAYVRPTDSGPIVSVGILKHGGLVYMRRKTNKLNENTGATISEPSVYGRPSDSDPCISTGSLKQWGLVYTRRCKKDKECQEKDGGVVGKSNPCDDTRNQNRLNCNGNGTVLHVEECNGKLDRYTLKYSKRPVGLKAISSNGPKILYDDTNVASKARAVGVGLL